MSFSEDDKELPNWMEAKNYQSVNLKQVALLEVPAFQITKLAFSQYLALDTFSRPIAFKLVNF